MSISQDAIRCKKKKAKKKKDANIERQSQMKKPQKKTDKEKTVNTAEEYKIIGDNGDGALQVNETASRAEDHPAEKYGEMSYKSYASVAASSAGKNTSNQTSIVKRKPEEGCQIEQKEKSRQDTASAAQQELECCFQSNEYKNKQKADLCFYKVKEILVILVEEDFFKQYGHSASIRDITPILDFLLNCPKFKLQEFGDLRKSADQVRRHRNDFVHNYESKPVLPTDMLNKYRRNMVELLKNKKIIATGKADEACNFIEQVCKLDYKITFDEELKAKFSGLEGQIELLRSKSEEFMRQIAENEKQKANKSDVDKLIKEKEMVEQKISSMQCKFVHLKRNIEKVQRLNFYTELPWNLTVEDLNKAWPSIEDHLSEELAPKNLLLFFLSAEEEKLMKQRSRTEVAKYLLQQIKENLPNGFLSLLNALHQTQQKVIIDQLEVKIKETQNLQLKTDNQATNDDKMESKAETDGPRQQKGKEQSAEEGTILRLTVLHQGRQQHMTELNVGNHLKGQAVFSFDINSVCMKFEPGSVIIYLRPLSKHAKETLLCFCKYGGMKNFVLDLLKKKDILLSLPDGEVNIHIEVRYGKDSAFEDAGGQHGNFEQMVEKEPVSQDDNVKFTDNPQVIKQNLILQYGSMVEEIEPLQFQGTFVNGGILDKSSFEELEKIQRRRARAAHFLNQVLDKGDTAFAALVDALRNSGNDDLANKLCTVQKISSESVSEGQVDDRCIEVIQEVIQVDSEIHAEVDLLWSCGLTVAVKKNEDGDELKRKLEASATSTLQVPEVQVIPREIRRDIGKLHEAVLTQCLPVLMRDLDVRAVCLFIQQKELFDCVTIRDILEQITESDKIRELIKRIKQRDQVTYEEFKECLVLANQSYLKDLLEEEEARVSIKETHEAQGIGKLRHRAVLTRCLPALMMDLDVRAVLKYIQMKELFDCVTIRDILEQPTTSKKIRELIIQIQQRDRETYEKFKECLVLAKQSFLKHLLEEEEAQVSEQIKETHEAQGIGNSDTVLKELSRDLFLDWKYFLRELSVEESELMRVEMEYSRDRHEQIYQLLLSLKQKGSLNNATIIQALKGIGRKDLLEKYSELKYSLETDIMIPSVCL